MADVYLKPGREKAVHNRHPWIFAGAIGRTRGSPADGDVVDVRDAAGVFLARGYLNSRSQIAIRLLTWNPGEGVDESFWRARIARAVARRVPGWSPTLPGSADEAGRVPGWSPAFPGFADDTTAYRLVYAEADHVPGLIVDRYGPYLAVQFLTLGVDRWRAVLTAALQETLAPAGIYERSDVEVRAQEGLPPAVGLLAGELPPPEIEILENGHRFLVDLAGGQKTGFYLDQRENRRLLAGYAAGREMLDAFCFSGGFGLYAAAAGAGPVTLLDASAEALDLARRNMQRNGLQRETDTYQQGDVFEVLRGYRDRGRSFDLIVLDPPKFAPTQRHVQRATRAYKDINLLALKLLRTDGLLFTFSCSGGVDADLFQKIVFGAAVDAGRETQILHRLFQGSDHPVLLSFPESAYLKGLACRVME